MEKKLGIITYGCSVNKADSEIMANALAEAGFVVELGSVDAELVIVNSCIVKGPTENKILRKISDLRSEGKGVIVAGCLPKAYPKRLSKVDGIAVMGTNAFDVVEVVRNYLKEGEFSKVRFSYSPKVGNKKIRNNPFIEIVEISEGCMNACSYCATRLARGKLKSYPLDAIVKEVKDAVSTGAKEIWLTSQDNGCYGFDIGTNLAELLKEVVTVPGDFRVRVGMMNPTHIKSFLDELIEVYKNPKIFKFAHIPVQSGSDKVLKEMRRGYTTKDFESIVSKFREAMDVTISTDIIVGFPTETEEDFEATVDMLKSLRPDFLNLSKYWPRKRTIAGEMKQLPRGVVSARSKEIAKLFSSIMDEKNKDWSGKICEVIFTGKKGDYYVGRNLLYRPVLVRSNKLGFRQQPDFFDRTFSKRPVGRNSLCGPILVKSEDLLGKKCSVKIKTTKKSEVLGEIV